MKTVLFARVSSRDQEEAGYSLPSQEKLLVEYTERKGFKIAKTFSVSESASGKNQRKIFNEMMRYVRKNNIKIIICEKTDRITRNFKDAVLINEWLNKDKNRQIHLVKDSLVLHKDSRSQEKLNWNIRIVFAQNYIDNLSEEVKKGQMEKLRQGWLPTKPPLGYKTIGETGHKIHIIDESKAPMIKKMFELYATRNYSLKRLVEKMYEEGLRTRGGNKLVKSRLAELLSDPFYYGKNRWNGKIYDGKQKLLISKETFDRIQEILKSRSTPKYRKYFPLFKKSICCGECNGTITWSIAKGHWYGYCNRYRKCSQKKYIRQEKTEEQLLIGLSNLEIKNTRVVEWIRKALKESCKDKTEYHTTVLNELNQRYSQAQKRLDRLYDDKLDEKINKEFYERKFKQYSEEKEVITQSIQKHSKADTKHFELGMNIYELSQKARETYLQSTKEEKRQLINLVFDNLWLRDCKLAFSYSISFKVLSEAVKLINSSKVLDLAESSQKIFEPQFQGQKRAKMPEFDEMLRGEDSNLQPKAYTLS